MITPMQEQCPSSAACAAAPDNGVIPRPSPSMVAMFVNTNRNSLPFLQAAGIAVHSKEHKKLMTTIQALHRQYLDPFKYLEEQAPDRVDELITEARISLSWLDKYEDGWPARIYLKRYVDTKRPHLMCTRYSRTNPQKARKSKASGKMPTKDTPVSQNFLNMVEYLNWI
ncbi:hypothetical protein V8E55_010919 [Tylopilus felleus]